MPKNLKRGKKITYREEKVLVNLKEGEGGKLKKKYFLHIVNFCYNIVMYYFDTIKYVYCLHKKSPDESRLFI